MIIVEVKNRPLKNFTLRVLDSTVWYWIVISSCTRHVQYITRNLYLLEIAMRIFLFLLWKWVNDNFDHLLLYWSCGTGFSNMGKIQTYSCISMSRTNGFSISFITLTIIWLTNGSGISSLNETRRWKWWNIVLNVV